MFTRSSSPSLLFGVYTQRAAATPSSRRLHRSRSTGVQRKFGERTLGQNPSTAVAIRRCAYSHSNEAFNFVLLLPLSRYSNYDVKMAASSPAVAQRTKAKP